MRSQPARPWATAVAAAVLLAFAFSERVLLSYAWVRTDSLLSAKVERTGTVMHQTLNQTAGVTGRVERILANSGDHVLPGQPLVELANPAVMAELEVARAQLAAATEPFGGYVLSSPVSGTVLKVYRINGEIVPARAPILAVGDPTRLRVIVPTSGVVPLPVPGQLAWVYSSTAATENASVAAVRKDEIEVALPEGSSHRINDVVQVRFDPAEPIVLVTGSVTASVVTVTATRDGRLVSVAAEGAAVAAGQPVAEIEHSSKPDAASALRIAQARQALLAAQSQVDGLTIRASAAGTFQPAVELKQAVASGEPIGSIVLSSLSVQIAVPGDQAALWQPGQVVTVTREGATALSTVTHVEESMPANTVVVAVPEGLAVGDTVSVLPGSEDAAVVPVSAVTSDGAHFWVMRLGPLWPRRQEVTVLAQGAGIAVISGVGHGQLIGIAR